MKCEGGKNFPDYIFFSIFLWTQWRLTIGDEKCIYEKREDDKVDGNEAKNLLQFFFQLEFLFYWNRIEDINFAIEWKFFWKIDNKSFKSHSSLSSCITNNIITICRYPKDILPNNNNNNRVRLNDKVFAN